MTSSVASRLKTLSLIALSIIAEIVATRYDRVLVPATASAPANDAEETLESIEETVEVAGD